LNEIGALRRGEIEARILAPIAAASRERRPGRRDRVRRRDFIGAIAAGLVGGLTGVGLAAPPPIGMPAPDFSLVLTDGRTISLKDFRGKAVLVNFWGSG
jgi:hypothetical protein